MLNHRLYPRVPNGYRALTPVVVSPTRLGLKNRFTVRLIQHFTLGFHQTPPRGSLSFPRHLLFKSALASSVSGSLRQGPERTSTSYSAPMPGAPLVQRTVLVHKRSHACGELRRGLVYPSRPFGTTTYAS